MSGSWREAWTGGLRNAKRYLAIARHEEYSYFVICLPECPDHSPNGAAGAIAIYNPPHPFGWVGEESTIVLLL
jgi:hypothetical protein